MVYCSILKLLIEGFSLVNQHLPGFAGSFLCALGCRPLSGHSSTAGNAVAVLLHSQPPKPAFYFSAPVDSARVRENSSAPPSPHSGPGWQGGGTRAAPSPSGGPGPAAPSGLALPPPPARPRPQKAAGI